MKILLATGIYPPESGGPATYTAGLFSELKKRGHDVRVIAYGDPSLKEEGVTRISRSGGPVVRYLRYAWNVRRLAKDTDVVYAQGPVSEGLPATVATMLLGKPVVMKVVGDYAWEMAQQHGEKDLLDAFLTKRHHGVIRFYEWAERWTARRAKRVIVPSKYLKTVVARWSVPEDRIQVIKNSVTSIPGLPVEQQRTETRQRMGLGDRKVFFTAVRAVPWKGVAELINWWKQLPSSHVLIVAGDGPELSDWKELARQQHVEDRIQFLGRVARQDMGVWYGIADAFLLHSGYEGYPHVIPEAVMFGLPCFVSDQGGNPETVGDFPEHVIALPYQDEHAWVAALSAFSKGRDFSGMLHAQTENEMWNITEEVLTTYARR